MTQQQLRTLKSASPTGDTPAKTSQTSPSHLNDRRITLEQLRAFVAVAEELDFQRASHHLGRSQSALTQSLQKLEDILECRLIARRRGQVEDVTENGKRLLPLAEEILSRLSAAVDSFRQPALQGRIRLGVPDDFPLGNIAGPCAAAWKPTLPCGSRSHRPCHPPYRAFININKSISSSTNVLDVIR